MKSQYRFYLSERAACLSETLSVVKCEGFISFTFEAVVLPLNRQNNKDQKKQEICSQSPLNLKLLIVNQLVDEHKNNQLLF